MYEATDEEFEQAVIDGIASVPERFRDDIENLAFVVEDEPSSGEVARARAESGGRREVLGLYSGVPLPERNSGYGLGSPRPDVITIYRGPHQRCSNSHDDLVERVRRTIVHEIGHYFGMDEDQLREMGYGST